MRLTRRRLVAAAGGLFLTAGGAWKVLPAPASEATTVRVGMLSPNLVSVIHYIAKRTGAYEKAGVVIVEHPFPSGETSSGIGEMIRGNLDAFIGAGAEIPRANSLAIDAGKASPLIVIQGGTAGVTTFVLRNDWRGRSFDDLKGKPLKIGVSSPSSIHLALFQAYLLERRLTTKDLGWQFLGMEAGNMVPALKVRQIDGFLHSEPTTTLALTNDAGFVFMSARHGDMGVKARVIPVTFVSANRGWVVGNRDAVRRFVAALNDANAAYAKMSKAQMVGIMAEWAKQPTEIVSQAYDRLDPRMNMTLAGAHAWWDVIGSSMRERGEITGKVRFEDVFDVNYLSR